MQQQPPHRPTSPAEFRRRLIQTIEEALLLIDDDIEELFPSDSDTRESRD
jgi:hypothetical protein